MKLKTQKQQFGARMKYGATAAAILLLLFVAAGIGAVARPVTTQSAGGSSTSAAGARGQWDLNCTYYYLDGHAEEGTCETHKRDKTNYFCSANSDRKLSQFQIGCKAKVEFAKAHKIKVEAK